MPCHFVSRVSATSTSPIDILGNDLFQNQRLMFPAGAETDYPATAPNLLANFVKIVSGKRLDTYANATSQAFYVLRCDLNSKANAADASKRQSTAYLVRQPRRS